jgi:tellurite methyltransferase
MANWKNYHSRTANSPPRPTLLKALTLLPTPGHAIDLGCGSGRDALHLLEQGWTVLAIDNQQTAIDRLQIPPPMAQRCSTMCANFEEAELGRALLINASFSLPFCDPTKAASLWSKIETATDADGIFCGQFFGPDDDWADRGLWTIRSSDLRAMLSGWTIEHFEEFQGERPTVAGPTKWWHIFDVVARRTAIPH